MARPIATSRTRAVNWRSSCRRASRGACPTRVAWWPSCFSSPADCARRWGTPAAATSSRCAPARCSCASPAPACARATYMTSRSPRRRPIIAPPERVAAAGATAADIHADRVLIVDFGSQYTQLIARRVRELGVYCEIHPWDMTAAAVRAFGARGVILSGGPESVTAEDAPAAPAAVFELGVPVLEIRYGMHTMAAQLDGPLVPGDVQQ